MAKPELLIISHAYPYPNSSGQSQRIQYMIRAAREFFNVTFLTYAEPNQVDSTRARLLTYVDEAIVLPSLTASNFLSKVYHKLMAKAYSFITDLKESNYVIGRVELSKDRIARAITPKKYDLVIFEYFHAYKSAELFKKLDIPVVLDTHNILWQAVKANVLKDLALSGDLKDKRLEKYKLFEEAAWSNFDYVIGINKIEYNYISSKIAKGKAIYLPMGIDMSKWIYAYAPVVPEAVAFYGSLGSIPNQKSVMICVKEIMPVLWKQRPDLELWLIGAAPTEEIKKLGENDKRIKVTGFVEDVAAVLGKTSLLLCPWQGTYGFRSRIVEVMATGVPVIATPEAVDGMDLENGKGIYLTDSHQKMAEIAEMLLNDPAKLKEQSILAREEAIRKYSYENTYSAVFNEMYKTCIIRSNPNTVPAEKLS